MFCLRFFTSLSLTSSHSETSPELQAARHGCKGAFNLWKQQNFSDNGEVHDVYRTKRREYRKHLRKFLNQIEIDKAAKLQRSAIQ